MPSNNNTSHGHIIHILKQFIKKLDPSEVTQNMHIKYSFGICFGYSTLAILLGERFTELLEYIVTLPHNKLMLNDQLKLSPNLAKLFQKYIPANSNNITYQDFMKGVLDVLQLSQEGDKISKKQSASFTRLYTYIGTNQYPNGVPLTCVATHTILDDYFKNLRYNLAKYLKPESPYTIITLSINALPFPGHVVTLEINKNKHIIFRDANNEKSAIEFHTLDEFMNYLQTPTSSLYRQLSLVRLMMLTYYKLKVLQLPQNYLPNEAYILPTTKENKINSSLNQQKNTKSYSVTKAESKIDLPLDKEKNTELHSLVKETVKDNNLTSLEKLKKKIPKGNKKQIDIDVNNKYGHSPLFTAYIHGEDFEKTKRVVEFLESKGANGYPKDNLGQTILHIASQNGSLDIVKNIMKKYQKEADPNLADKNGNTPIHAALASNHLEIAKCLINSDKFKPETINYHSYWPITYRHDTILSLAAKNGDKETINLLLEKSSDYLTIDTLSNAIMAGINAGNEDIAKILINKYSKMKQSQETQGTLQKLSNQLLAKCKNIFLSSNVILKLAITSKQFTIAHDLIQQKCINFEAINIKDAHGNTPLHIAATYGDVDTVKLLLEKGADPHITNTLNKTPLEIAIINGNFKLVKTLIDKQKELDENTQWHKLGYASASATDQRLAITPKLAATLKLAAICVNQHQHSKNGTPEEIKKYEEIENYLVDNSQENTLSNNIEIAIIKGKITQVKEWVKTQKLEEKKSWWQKHLSITSKATQPTPNRFDIHFLGLALTHQQPNIAQYLIEEGCFAANKINHQNQRGNTLLHLAVIACGNNVETTKKLLEKGADPRITNKAKTTPIEIAIINGNLELVQVLLEKQKELAKSRWENPFKKTNNNLLKLSFIHQQPQIAQYLIKHNCFDSKKINSEVFRKDTLLHLATRNNDIESTKLLLQQGADPRITNEAGTTPIEIAIVNGNLELVQILVEKQKVLERNKSWQQKFFSNIINFFRKNDNNILENLYNNLLKLSEAHNHPEITKYLNAQKADLRITNYSNESSFEVITKKKNEKSIDKTESNKETLKNEKESAKDNDKETIKKAAKEAEKPQTTCKKEKEERENKNSEYARLNIFNKYSNKDDQDKETTQNFIELRGMLR